MKKSHFAYCFALGDGDYALLNTSSGRLALCDQQHADAFYKGKGPEEIISNLFEAGFIVEDDIDEIEIQRLKFQNAYEDNSQLFLSIAPTYACNCRCAYCYEQDKRVEKAPLTKEIEDAIYVFLEERYADLSFSSLFVEWYGGDPQLCLDIVKRMSQHFIRFSEEKGIAYDSVMLSNSTRIGSNDAKLIAECGISSMLVTIDGPEDLHNARRPAIDIDNAYQAIIEAIGFLQKEGVRVNAAMNADKVNMARFEELQSAMAAIDVVVTPVLLNDYAHTFGAPCEKRFCKPSFDLYDHEEFAHARYEQLKQEGFNAAMLQALFAPFDRFCSGQLESSYVIDALGDVYKCDGWMGDKTRSVFNLLDVESRNAEANHHKITFDPFQDDKCSACKLLPLCMGNCSWERELTGWPCHPFKYTLEDYVKSYSRCFPRRSKSFELHS